jgi:Uri superfamily endonuclease
MKIKEKELKLGYEKVQKITDLDKGIYILELAADQRFNLNIKKFKDELFPIGFYYYVGSAQKNFGHRLKRHLLKNKNIHWHIDHLTTNNYLKMKNVYVFKNAAKTFECKLVQSLVENFKLQYPVNGFGNSDCRLCKSHLLFNKKKITSSIVTS